MINRVRASSESQILRLTSDLAECRMKPVHEGLLAEDGLAAADGEKIANKIWTTRTWAAHDGDVPFWCGERLHRGEVDLHGVWRGTLAVTRDGSTKLGSTTEEFSATLRWRDGRVKERTGYNS